MTDLTLEEKRNNQNQANEAVGDIIHLTRMFKKDVAALLKELGELGEGEIDDENFMDLVDMAEDNLGAKIAKQFDTI